MNLARAIDEEFAEIPFDRIAEQPAFFALEPDIERVGILAIDVDL